MHQRLMILKDEIYSDKYLREKERNKPDMKYILNKRENYKTSKFDRIKIIWNLINFHI